MLQSRAAAAALSQLVVDVAPLLKSLAEWSRDVGSTSEIHLETPQPLLTGCRQLHHITDIRQSNLAPTASRCHHCKQLSYFS